MVAHKPIIQKKKTIKKDKIKLCKTIQLTSTNVIEKNLIKA
jgi:hypothetical protein